MVCGPLDNIHCILPRKAVSYVSGTHYFFQCEGGRIHSCTKLERYLAKVLWITDQQEEGQTFNEEANLLEYLAYVQQDIYFLDKQTSNSLDYPALLSKESPSLSHLQRPRHQPSPAHSLTNYHHHHRQETTERLSCFALPTIDSAVPPLPFFEAASY